MSGKLCRSWSDATLFDCACLSQYLRFFIPHHTTVAECNVFMLVVCVSVSLSVHPSVIRTSVFLFLDDNFSINTNGFSPNLVCALILCRSDLGLLMGKVYQFLTELSACDTSVFLFQDNNLCKSQWFFTKLDVWLILWRPGLGLLLGNCQCLTVTSLCHDSVGVLSFHVFICLKSTDIFLISNTKWWLSRTHVRLVRRR